jgi:hypothetical protein
MISVRIVEGQHGPILATLQNSEQWDWEAGGWVPQRCTGNCLSLVVATLGRHVREKKPFKKQTTDAETTATG